MLLLSTLGGAWWGAFVGMVLKVLKEFRPLFVKMSKAVVLNYDCIVARQMFGF